MRSILFFWILLSGAACSEIPPVINPIEDSGGETGDTTSIGGQDRQVLIEEFSGVRCVNCPAGAAAIEGLLDTYEERLWAISIHAGFFARTYPESRYDFRTPDGNSLLTFLGEPLGYPTAVINRRVFDGEGDLQLGQPLWPGFIQQELQRPRQLAVGLSRTFDPLTLELTVTVQIEVDADLVATDIRLSLALTEDGIVDRQLTPDGERDDYVHNHVLRDMITNFDGNPLPAPLTAGQRLTRSFRYTLDPGWNAEKCTLIAFVHLGGERKEVLQANGVGVVE